MKKIRDGYKTYEFGEIPSGWNIKKIGDIFNDLRAGSTPSRKIEEYFTGDIPWITSGELKYRTIYNTIESITEEAVKDTNLEIYPEGTFFIAITGLEAGGTRGSCAISGVKATTNQSCMAFKPKQGFSNLYLYYWYRLYGDYIGLKYTQGTKQQSLNNKIVQELEIPVPMLKEQEKISSILSTVDEQICNVDELIEKNKELKKGLMQQLLTKGIGHTKFKKSDIGEIPEEWEVKKLGDISEVNPKKEIKEDNSIVSFIAMEDVSNNGRVTKMTDKLYGDVKKAYTFFSNNDVLLAKITPCFENGKRALVKKLSNGIGFGSTEFHVLRAKKISVPGYLYYVIASHRFTSKAESNMTGSAGQKRVPTNFVKEYLIALPTVKEQEKIALILSEVDGKIEEYEAKKKKLEELKKGLMQQLLTGKIRVI